jgi:hypothetical protein
MIKSEIVKRLKNYPPQSRFTYCEKCMNIVHSQRHGEVINNGSGNCRYPVKEVSKAELVELLR